MANTELFRPAFDALATNDVIGDPAGRLAYAYVRVSSDDQAEEGRSGLPRQIEHIHEAALKYGYRITWDLVYADDFTGFDFESRPSLSNLRREYRSSERRAHAVIMEHLDRLSRNADWHQGYLLDEMRRFKVEPVFWKTFSSRIERAVMGAIAQDGMEQAIERMRTGTLNKARSGRVTAKVPAFGYKLVDQYGQENTHEARKNTYYAIVEGQAYVVCFMFEAIAYRGMSSYELLKEVDERAKSDPRFRAPRGRAWNERTFVKMLRNPVYKGEFIANRYYKEKVTTFDEHGVPKTAIKERQRPEEEWIRVEVPAIVDEETWETANRNLFRNKGFARRNKKYVYLLTDLIVCATCGRRYHGHTENTRKKIQRYTCSTMHQRPAVRELRPCGQTTIRCELIDSAVWTIIAESLLNPELIAEAIEARYSNEQVDDVRQQIAYLERAIPTKDTEEAKLKQAYLVGAYTVEEFASERKRLLCEREILLTEASQLRTQIMTPEELEERKGATQALVEHARTQVDIQNAPFELRRQIIRLLVDRVQVNVKEEWFEIEGTVGSGLLFLTNDGVVGMPTL